MIIYIDTQLNMWAAWLRTGRQNLGYPRQAAFLNDHGGRGKVIDISDSAAGDIDKAVNALPADQKQIVKLIYVEMRSFTAEAIAARLKCHRDTVYARLHAAHVRIMEALKDV